MTVGSQPVRTEQDVVLARQTVRKLVVQCGLRLVDQTKLVTAASELARNTVIYGGGGDMDWALVESGIRKGGAADVPRPGPGHCRPGACTDRRLDLWQWPGAGTVRQPAAGGRFRAR